MVPLAGVCVLPGSLPIGSLDDLWGPRMRTLVLVPRFGLGNVLRAFSSSWAYALLSQRRLVRLHAGDHHHALDSLCCALRCGIDAVLHSQPRTPTPEPGSPALAAPSTSSALPGASASVDANQTNGALDAAHAEWLLSALGINGTPGVDPFQLPAECALVARTEKGAPSTEKGQGAGGVAAAEGPQRLLQRFLRNRPMFPLEMNHEPSGTPLNHKPQTTGQEAS